VNFRWLEHWQIISYRTRLEICRCFTEGVAFYQWAPITRDISRAKSFSRSDCRSQSLSQFYRNRLVAIRVSLFPGDWWINTGIAAESVPISARRVPGRNAQESVLTTNNRTQSVEKEYDSINKYREKWRNQVQRMSGNRIPREMMKYQLPGLRNSGRPTKSLQDQIWVAATVLGPNYWCTRRRRRISMKIIVFWNAS
jgi:hypothetical protein